MKTFSTPEEAALYIRDHRPDIVAVDYGDGKVTVYEAGDVLPQSSE